jgi:GTP-binding protein
MKTHFSGMLVALVGRPNVGKSTMFNVLVGSRKALVDGTPGLTRDRNYAEVTMMDKSFVVVDTGGFEPNSDDVLLSQMRTQTTVAIEEADVIVFMGDAKVGVTPSDYEIVRVLQRTDKKVLYLANKVDSEKQEPLSADFCALGVDPIFAVSAMTGFGMDEFLDALLAEVPAAEPTDAETASAGPVAKLAVVGRPNVGKSTLVNLLLGKERLVANPQPGTTRDSIDTIVRFHGREYLFIDTAGIRRRSRIVDRVEKYSVIKAFQSIDRADVALIMMDATEPATDQDARIAGYAHDKARGVIVLLNKWDLVQKDSNTHERFIELVRRNLKYIDHAPVLTISASEGTRAVKVFGLVDELVARYNKRVPTWELNRFLEETLRVQPPGFHRGNKPVKIYYLTQVRTAPPTFLFFCNYPESVHFSYLRFLENQLREKFDFGGSPLRLVLRKRQDKAERGGHRPRRR